MQAKRDRPPVLFTEKLCIIVHASVRRYVRIEVSPHRGLSGLVIILTSGRILPNLNDAFPDTLFGDGQVGLGMAGRCPGRQESRDDAQGAN
jgi:hypothetical protein